MSQIKYSFISILCYALVFLIPGISNGETITASLSYLIGTAVLVFLYQKRQPLPFETHFHSLQKIILIGVMGIILTVLLIGIAGYVENFFSVQTNFNRSLNMMEVMWQRPIFAFIATICGPIMEELVFRRACIGFFSEYSSLPLAILLSSLAFALVHTESDILVYFILGCFLSLVYVKSSSIKTAIISHCGANIVVLIIQVLRFKP